MPDIVGGSQFRHDEAGQFVEVYLTSTVSAGDER